MEKIKEKLNCKNILITIFIIASLLRIIFISFSKIDEFQYDVGAMNLENSESYEKVLERDENFFLVNRHLDYILTIYETGKLPETNDVQFYHPPLYHIISAVWLKTFDFMDFSAETMLESLQIVTCIYSIITLLIIWKILEELEINDKLKILAFSLCAFHPLLIYMSGLLNNDTLLTMFSVLSILYILKWYKQPNLKNAIILAIIIGLGTLTKTSMLVNLGIAGIAFFIKLLESIAKQEYKITKNILLQGIVFFIIALPLIFCYPIRNYKLFNQAFFGIHDAAEWLYVGNENLVERFGIFSKEILNNVLEYENKNVLSYVIKSAIVFEVSRQPVLGTTFIKYLSIVLIIATIIAIIKLMFSKDRRNYILISGYYIWIIFFISFNYEMPNSCTMHSRYIVTVIVLSIICLVKALQECKTTKWVKIVSILSGIFCLSSSIIVLLNTI